MIESGEVACFIANNDGPNKVESECFRRLKQGDFFGELALLSAKPRAVSIDVVKDAKFYLISAGSFERLLGPIASILERNQDHYHAWMSQMGIKLDGKK